MECQHTITRNGVCIKCGEKMFESDNKPQYEYLIGQGKNTEFDSIINEEMNKVYTGLGIPSEYLAEKIVKEERNDK